MKSIAIDDCIMQKDTPVMSGTKMFDGMVSPINAEVIRRLEIVNYSVNTHFTTKDFGVFNVLNDNNEVSSATKAVLNEDVLAFLTNDLFGIYRKEAAENNLVYIYPSYGTVSRFGLVQMAPSMDQIGILCKDINVGFEILEYISGNDPKDGVMFSDSSYIYAKDTQGICISFDEYFLQHLNETDRTFFRNISSITNETNNAFSYFDKFKDVMYILCSAEFSHSINRYDGNRYGLRAISATNLEEIYISSRTEGFSLDTKLMGLVGTKVLSEGYYTNYYEKAMKLRHLIKEAFDFTSYDLIAIPTKISCDSYINSSLWAISPLCGFSSLTFSIEGIGIQLLANAKNESALYTGYSNILSKYQ